MRKKVQKTERQIRAAIRIRFLQLIVEGLITLAAVILLYNSLSLGWFVNNKEVTGTGMKTQIEVIDLDASFSVYTHDATQRAVTEIRNIQDTLSVSCPPVDLVFDHNNTYTPVAIRIELTGKELKKNRNIRIDLSRTGNAFTGKQLEDYFSSNMIRFTGLSVKSSKDIGSSIQRYDYVHSLLSSNDAFNVDSYVGRVPAQATNIDYTIGTSDCFTKYAVDHETPDNSQFQVSKSIVINIPYQREYLNKPDSERPSLVVYLYLSYDSNMKNQYKNRKGVGINRSEPLVFPNDLQELSIIATPDYGKEIG